MKPGREKNLNSCESEESDSETIEQTSHSYEHLINEIKIKSTALAKASNLIEILQIQVPSLKYSKLEVQKSSKEEAIRQAEYNTRMIYQKELFCLQEQIQTLNQRKNIPKVHSTELRRQDSKTLSRCDSRSLNRSRSRDASVFGNTKSIKRVDADHCLENQSSFEVKLYRKILIEMFKCDQSLLDQLSEIEETEKSQIEKVFENCEEEQKGVLNWISESATKLKKIENLERQGKEMKEIIESQMQIITNMNIYHSSLEQLIRGISIKLSHIYDEKSNKPPRFFDQEMKESVENMVRLVDEWKLNFQDKSQKLRVENQQLRGIIEEMIELMKKKKISHDFK